MSAGFSRMTALVYCEKGKERGGGVRQNSMVCMLSVELARKKERGRDRGNNPSMRETKGERGGGGNEKKREEPLSIFVEAQVRLQSAPHKKYDWCPL